MRKMIALFVCVLFATSLIVVVGCSEKKQEPAKPAVEAPKPAAEPAKAAEPEKKAEAAKPAEAKPAEKAPEKK
jgi:hypothetical protein